MLGTAFPARRVLLVEQPGPWGLRGLADSKFDQAVAKELIRRCSPDGVRVQAIRRPGRDRESSSRAWALAETYPGADAGKLAWGRYENEAELLEQDWGAARPSIGDRSLEAAYLVCAHSSHDVCCAIDGRPVAAALEAVRPGQVWETSHLGGDRFAANVLVLPLGLVYGRVPVTAAGELIARTELGETMPEFIRGVIGYRSVAQVALLHAQRDLGIERVRRLRVVDCVGMTGEPGAVDTSLTRVRVHVPDLQRVLVFVIAASSDPAQLLTCHASRPSHSLRFEVVSVAEDTDSALIQGAAG